MVDVESYLSIVCYDARLDCGVVTRRIVNHHRPMALTSQVPGEMFTLAMAARERERGVVGSTSDILGFIATKLKASLELPFPERLQVSPVSIAPLMSHVLLYLSSPT